jgi:phage shock protein C
VSRGVEKIFSSFEAQTTEVNMNKRLYKSRKERILFGVCGGIAEYFEVDPVIVRLLAVIFAFTGSGVIVYIIAAFIMKDESAAWNPGPYGDAGGAERYSQEHARAGAYDAGPQAVPNQEGAWNGGNSGAAESHDGAPPSS